MKILKSVLFVFFVYISTLTVGAQQAHFNWQDDLALFINYNEQTDMIDAVAAIHSEMSQPNQFSLGIYIDGREYRKFFQYNQDKSLLYVEFEIPQDLDDSTSIYLSVKDAQYNELFTTIPTSYNLRNSSRNESHSVTSVFPSSTGEKDYGVFSMQVSTSTKSSTATHATHTHTSTTKRKNVSDLTRSELINRVQTGDYTQEEIPEIITILEEYKANDTTSQNSSNTQGNTTKKKSYTPKYKSQSHEPSSINGIGNSKSKSSWRVQ